MYIIYIINIQYHFNLVACKLQGMRLLPKPVSAATGAGPVDTNSEGKFNSQTSLLSLLQCVQNIVL